MPELENVMCSQKIFNASARNNLELFSKKNEYPARIFEVFS